MRTVWDWHPGPQGAQIRDIILKLKRFPSAPLVHWHATQLALAASDLARNLMPLDRQLNQREVEWILVYPPRGSNREFNLAEELAQSVGQTLGAHPLPRPFVSEETFRIGTNVGGQAQKKKSALGRQQIRYNLRDENVIDDSPQKKAHVFVFIDDVYATGATARAAYHALDQPAHFFVLCLAYRLSARRLGGVGSRR